MTEQAAPAILSERPASPPVESVASLEGAPFDTPPRAGGYSGRAVPNRIQEVPSRSSRVGPVFSGAVSRDDSRLSTRPAAKDADGRFIGTRAKKPKLLAIITDACTGCAGAPVCQIYCPVVDCMLLVPAEDLLPAGRIWVDPLKCVGCRKCVSRGPDDAFLDGCPWDAIVMVPTSQWEAEHGELAY